MQSMEIVDAIRIISTTIGFIIASWQDLKKREIEDRIWIILTIIGIPLLISEIIIRGLGPWLTLIMISITFSFGMGLILYKLDLFGGADAKALMTLSIMMPLIPEEIMIRTYTHPFTPISVFNNSVIGAALTSIYMITKNIKDKINGETLFKDLEKENKIKKLIAVITAHRIPLERLREEEFNYPIEEITEEKGRTKRKLIIRLGATAGEEKLKTIIKQYKEGKIKGEVWVTPALPMLIFITIGLIITLIQGDIIFKIILTLKS